MLNSVAVCLINPNQSTFHAQNIDSVGKYFSIVQYSRDVETEAEIQIGLLVKLSWDPALCIPGIASARSNEDFLNEASCSIFERACVTANMTLL